MIIRDKAYQVKALVYVCKIYFYNEIEYLTYINLLSYNIMQKYKKPIKCDKIILINKKKYNL